MDAPRFRTHHSLLRASFGDKLRRLGFSEHPVDLNRNRMYKGNMPQPQFQYCSI
jgi:hypothetical protein